MPAFGKAPEGEAGGFTASVTRGDANNGDNAIISFQGSSGNPLTGGVPTIDYNFTIGIIPGKDGGDPTIEITGEHDGFPAYEINVTDSNTGITYNIYHDEPNSKWEVRRLFGSSDTKVNEEN